MSVLTICRKVCTAQLISRQIKLTNQFHTFKKVDPIITTTIRNEQLISKRTFFGILKKRTKRELRERDKLSSQYELIYRCSVDNILLTMQHSCFYASVIIFLVVVYKAGRFYDPPHKKQEYLGEKKFPYQRKISTEESDLVGLTMGYIISYVLVTLISLRMTARIYYNPKKRHYLILSHGPIPNQMKTLKVKAGELVPTYGKNWFPWNQETFKCKETGDIIYLVEDYFRNTADLYVMLGWQKDPDLNYDSEEEPQNAKGKSNKQLK